jgi:protein phosphatase
MALALKIGKCTLRGNYRENNEDAIDVDQFPEFTVCLVADGMGGQAAGEIASKRAVEVIPRELGRNIPQARAAEETKKVIRRAVTQANEEIMAMGTLDHALRNMGTTVVLALWRNGNEIYITGVGDSRAYLLRGHRIEQLTVDHSLAQALVEAKTISAEEAREHRFRNVLWKYLGTKEVGEGPDVKAIPLQAGDRLILCTDGLTGVVNDERLVDFVRQQSDAQECADALCQLALDSGSKDNISCIVIEAVRAA